MCTVVFQKHNGLTLRSYIACGCGRDYALGALNILIERDYKPEYMIRKALEATSCYSNAVWPPYHIISLDLDKSVENCSEETNE